MFRNRLTAVASVLAALVAVGLAFMPAAGESSSGTSSATTVVVQQGQPVQIAFVGSGDLPDYTQSFKNAIQMAVGQHPTIRGFPIKINESDPSCGDAGANVAAANAIVSNLQNAAVIGHMCSSGFKPALPIYQNAGLVTISGSATDPSLPALGPNVFNRTAVADPDLDAWYAQVKALPSDLLFEQNYQNRFGAVPTDYTDLTFDATSLLLNDLTNVAQIVNGNLVINRAALASAVRNTTNYQGVSCTVTLDSSTGNRVSDPTSLKQCAARGLTASVRTTNPGPIPTCAADGSDCGPANTFWNYIHVANRNPLLNHGGPRTGVPNSFVINSIDEQTFIDGVHQSNLDATYTPPPNAAPFNAVSGRWPATVLCGSGPPCGDIRNPAVIPGEDTTAFYIGRVQNGPGPTGSFVFKYTIHGTLNGTPIDLIASSPPIQITG
jgi:hypothetical protein